MIKNILSPAQCAKCLGCCIFVDDDLIERPMLTDTDIKAAEEIRSCKYVPSGDLRCFDMDKDSEGIYTCPMLADNGCMMGSKKPFMCAIWPISLVKYNGRNAIAVSELCPSIFKMTNEYITETLGESFLDKCREAAALYPTLVQPKRDTYRFVAYL